jgi:hypothetical protein
LGVLATLFIPLDNRQLKTYIIQELSAIDRAQTSSTVEIWQSESPWDHSLKQVCKKETQADEVSSNPLGKGDDSGAEMCNISILFAKKKKKKKKFNKKKI